ncbi:hypothetical protein BD779DRAFT_1465399 [Infundibulicybe gibba]|nr:hypothetical protein BD779DRAFT_1465399 [Infundibulicybe gibba]
MWQQDTSMTRPASYDNRPIGMSYPSMKMKMYNGHHVFDPYTTHPPLDGRCTYRQEFGRKHGAGAEVVYAGIHSENRVKQSARHTVVALDPDLRGGGFGPCCTISARSSIFAIAIRASVRCGLAKIRLVWRLMIPDRRKIRASDSVGPDGPRGRGSAGGVMAAGVSVVEVPRTWSETSDTLPKSRSHWCQYVGASRVQGCFLSAVYHG